MLDVGARGNRPVAQPVPVNVPSAVPVYVPSAPQPAAQPAPAKMEIDDNLEEEMTAEMKKNTPRDPELDHGVQKKAAPPVPYNMSEVGWGQIGSVLTAAAEKANLSVDDIMRSLGPWAEAEFQRMQDTNTMEAGILSAEDVLVNFVLAESLRQDRLEMEAALGTSTQFSLAAAALVDQRELFKPPTQVQTQKRIEVSQDRQKKNRFKAQNRARGRSQTPKPSTEEEEDDDPP